MKIKQFIKSNFILTLILCLIVPLVAFGAARTLKTVLNEDTHENITLSGYAKVTGYSSYFGEMYITDSATEITINSTDEWHALEGDIVTGLVNGFTYAAGSNGVIASTADGGGGLVTITDVAHGLSAGDYIAQNGTTSYNGVFEVMTVPSADTYTITDTYVANESGYWQQGSNLTCDAGSAGTYRGQWNAVGIAAVINKTFDFTPCVNTTISTKAKARRKFSNVDYGSFSGGGLMVFAEGDSIQFLVKDTTDDTNVTIRTLDLNIVKI